MSNLAVKLPQYEGPFDELCALVRRHQYSLLNIPLAEIIRQFADYQERAEALDIEIGTEFVETAAWLIYLKSESLLPQTNNQSQADEQKKASLSRESLQSAMDFLRLQLESASSASSASNRPERNLSALLGTSAEDPSATVSREAPTIQDVLAAARNALQTARAHKDLPVAESDPFTVENRLAWIEQRVAEAGATQTISTAGWFQEQPTDGASVALFLALLELPRRGSFRLVQKREFMEIYLRAI